MHIARIAEGEGARLALVDPEAQTLRRTGATELDFGALGRLFERAGDPEPLGGVRWLPPVVPRVVVGVGLNYRSHAEEQGRALPAEPPLFLKNPRSVAGPFDAVPLHPASACLDYEAELGIVIGKAVFGCTPGEAEAAIAGWVIVQDYTLRDLVRPETLAIAKGGPNMAPIGPWLTSTASVSVEQASALAIKCWVNGELRQTSSTADMHFGPVALVHRIARHLPLGPGDVIATGSPGGSGVGFAPPRWLGSGDIVETAIEGLGRMRQQIVTRS